MNSMLKNLLLITASMLLINCSKIIKEDPYLEAESTDRLQAIDGMDMPNTSNNLDIPVVESSASEAAPDSRPPEMSFARKRSADENVVIIESQGMPTIEIFNDKDAWELMVADHGYNWQLLEEDPDNCQATFRFYDPIIEDVENVNFFKKLFTLNSTYIDRSGEYVLTCLKLPQKQQIWLQTLDFEAPSAYVVDDLFNHIFDAATAN